MPIRSSSRPCYIDHEQIFHIAFSEPLQHFVDLAHLDEFDVRGDVVLGTKLQHFARFTRPSAGGTCDAEAAPGDECWRERLRVGNAHEQSVPSIFSANARFENINWHAPRSAPTD